MVIWNTIIIFFMMYYTFVLMNLSIKGNREKIQKTNEKLNTFRKIPIKSVEQQKQFIDTKYPKKEKFKFTWKWLGRIILVIITSILLFRGYRYLFQLLNVEFKLWHVILIIILFPILVNLILRLFNLEKDDITIYFR